MTTILLSAGLSSRMKKNKLLLPYNGKTIIENTLLAAKEVSDRVIVVTGYEREKIEDVLCKYDVKFVFNKDYEKGQRGSTISGIEAVEDDDFAILPSDLPLIKKETLSFLFSSLKEETIVRPLYNGIPGHPVCYRKEHRDKLLSFSGSMKDYLKKEGFKTIPSSLDTVYDVDNPTRYASLLVFNGDLSILDRYID